MLKSRINSAVLSLALISMSLFLWAGPSLAAVIVVADSNALIQPARPADPSWTNEIVVMPSAGQYSAGFDESPVPQSTEVYINFAWESLGSATYGEHTVYLYIDDVLHTFSVASGLGSSEWLKLGSDLAHTFDTSGSFGLRVVVRDGGVDQGLTSYNPSDPQINNWSRSVAVGSDGSAHVRPVTPPGWDGPVVVASMPGDPLANATTTVNVGQTAYLNFAWTNIGDAAAAPSNYTGGPADTFTAKLYVRQGGNLVDTIEPTLDPLNPEGFLTGPGVSRVIEDWEYLFTSSSPGDYTLVLGVQAEGDGQEFMSAPLSITVGGELNLKPFAPAQQFPFWTSPVIIMGTTNPAEYAPFTPTAGQQFYVHYAWQNQSDTLDAGAHTAILYLDGVELDRTTVASLSGSNYQRAYTPHTVPSSGPYEFCLVVDEAGEVAEFDEADNQACATVNFAEEPITDEPNLQPLAAPAFSWPEPIAILPSSDATYQDYTPTVGQQFYVHYAWTNAGTAAAGGHTTTVYLDGVEVSSTAVAGSNIGQGQRASELLTATTAGPHNFSMVVDSLFEVDESDETDNEAAATASFAEAPTGPVVSLPQDLAATPGGQVVVPIEITGVPGAGIGAYALRLDWNDAVLSNPVVIDAGTLSEGNINLQSFAPPSDGVGKLSVGIGFGFSPAQDGTLINVQFDVAAGAPSGSTPVSFVDTNAKTALSTAGFEQIPATFTDGSLLVGEPIPVVSIQQNIPATGGTSACGTVHAVRADKIYAEMQTLEIQRLDNPAVCISLIVVL